MMLVIDRNDELNYNYHKTFNEVFKKSCDALRKLNIVYYFKHQFRKTSLFLNKL